MKNKEKTVNISFGKSGNGYLSPRISISIDWLRKMGINENEREVKVTFDGQKITIEKSITNN